MSRPVVLNVPLMERVLAHVITHPQHHNQGNWTYEVGPVLEAMAEQGHFAEEMLEGECETTACAAGWASLLNDQGYRVQQTFPGSRAFHVVGPRGGQYSFYSAGKKLLGLTEHQAKRLFYGNNETAIQYMKDLLNQATPILLTRGEVSSNG